MYLVEFCTIYDKPFVVKRKVYKELSKAEAAEKEWERRGVRYASISLVERGD